MLPLTERLEVVEMISLYVHLVDERRWDELDRVFTGDVVFDATGFGLPAMTSLDELRAAWSDPSIQHPLAHHVTDIVLEHGSAGALIARSKVLGIEANGRVTTATYLDELRLTEDGWRVSRRQATPRTSAGGPHIQSDARVD